MLYTRDQVVQVARMAAGAAAAAFMKHHPEDELPVVLPASELDTVVARIVAEVGPDLLDPKWGQIRATVDFGPMYRASPPEGGHKLRVIIWSGPDFRSPTIRQGAIFDHPEVGEWVRERVVEALETLGIPIDGRETPTSLLGGPVPEGEQYPRLTRAEAIDRLATLLDPHGSNEVLAAWAEEAKQGG